MPPLGGALSEQDEGISMETPQSNTAIKSVLFLALVLYAAIGGIIVLNEDYINSICMLSVLAGIPIRGY